MSGRTWGSAQVKIFLALIVVVGFADTRGVTRADLDNDGALDLLFSGVSGPTLLRGSLDASGAPTGVFTVGDEVDLSAVVSGGARASSWADYDQDGDLDVYLVQEGTDQLLRNDDGVFVDATATVQLPSTSTSTAVAAWVDVDNDRDVDLFVGWSDPVGAPGLGRSALYINSGGPTPTFTDVAATGDATEAIPALGNVRAVKWADVSGDGQIDLLVACAKGPGQSQGNLLVGINDGYGQFSIQSVERGFFVEEDLISLEVFDFDGNGALDVIAVPSDATTPRVLAGFGSAATRGHVDVAVDLALGTGETFGVTTMDVNGDSDLDVFLLRPSSGGADHLWANPLYDAMPAAGSAQVLNIAFDSDANTPNRFGIGTMVRVRAHQSNGDVLATAQVVDGGSGRGSQSAEHLSIGIGDASTAEIRVSWPDGGYQVFDAASMPGFPNVTITNTTDPEILNVCQTWEYLIGSGNTVHTFKWLSRFDGGTPQVLIDQVTPNTSTCRLPLGGQASLVLEAGVPGVSALTVLKDTSDLECPQAEGQDWYEHTVTWATSCMAPCTYRFTPRISRNGAIYTADPQSMRVGVCADIFQQ